MKQVIFAVVAFLCILIAGSEGPYFPIPNLMAAGVAVAATIIYREVFPDD